MADRPGVRPPVPVVIIGGYLGAGKTTLVNHLLRSAGERIMVLVNDFGSSSIDASLVEARDGDVVQLAGGCVCCQIGDDLAGALARVLDDPPDRVVIETSGVAQPAAVATMVGLFRGLRVDAVVVVADAGRIDALLADRYVGDLVAAQLAQADLLVVNRGEPPAGLRSCTAAPVIDGDEPPPVAALTGPRSGDRWPADLPDAGHRFASFVIDGRGDPGDLCADVAALPGLVRAKGFVHAADGSVHVVHVAGRRVALERWSRPGPPPPPGVVCITVTGSGVGG